MILREDPHAHSIRPLIVSLECYILSINIYAKIL